LGLQQPLNSLTAQHPCLPALQQPSLQQPGSNPLGPSATPATSPHARPGTCPPQHPRAHSRTVCRSSAATEHDHACSWAACIPSPHA
jgi:hypothetical protein